MAPSERTHLLTVRMQPEELGMLKRLAEADGISASDLVRQFIRRTYAARFPEKMLSGRPGKKK